MRKLLAAAIILAVTLVGIGVLAGSGIGRATPGSHGDLLLTYDLNNTDVSVAPIDTTCRVFSAGSTVRTDVVAKNAVDWAGMDFVINFPAAATLTHPVLADGTANLGKGLDQTAGVDADPAAGFDFVPAFNIATFGADNLMSSGAGSVVDYTTTQAAPTSSPQGVSMFDNTPVGESGDGGMARISLDTTGMPAGVYIISLGTTGTFAGGVHTGASGFQPDSFGAVFFAISPTACPAGTPTPAPTGTPTPVPTATAAPGTATPTPTATAIPTPTPLCGPGVGPLPNEPPSDGSALLCHYESNIQTATEPPDTCTIGLECTINTLNTVDEDPPTAPQPAVGATLNPSVNILTSAVFDFATDIAVPDGDEVGNITVVIRTDGGFLGACSADLTLGPNPLQDGTIDFTTTPDAGGFHSPVDLFNPLVWPQQLNEEVAAVQAAFGGPFIAPLYSRNVTTFDIGGGTLIPLNILYFKLNPLIGNLIPGEPAGGWVTQSFTGDPLQPAPGDPPAINPLTGLPIIAAPPSGALFCTPFSADTTVNGTTASGVRYRTCNATALDPLSVATIDPDALNPAGTGDEGTRIDSSNCVPLKTCGPGVSPLPNEPPSDGSALLCHYESNINTPGEGTDTCAFGLECSINTLNTVDEDPPTGAQPNVGATLNPSVNILTSALFDFATDAAVPNGDAVGSITVVIRTDGGFLGACSADLALGPNTLLDGTIDVTTSPVVAPGIHSPVDLFNPLVWPQQLTGERAAVEAAFDPDGPGPIPSLATLHSRNVTIFDIGGGTLIPLNILYWKLNPAIGVLIPGEPAGGWVTQSFTGDPLPDPAVNPLTGAPIIPAPPSGALFCTPFSADTTVNGTTASGVRYRTCNSTAGDPLSVATIDPNALNPTSADAGTRIDSSNCVAAKHDAQLRRIQTSFSALSGLFDAANPDEREIFVQVRNESDHPENIGVYVDVIPPGGSANPGGCLPAGRILEGSITLAARGTTGDTGNLFADTHTPNLAGSTTGGVGHVDFSCTNQSAVVGQRYFIIAVVDAHGDDLVACPLTPVPPAAPPDPETPSPVTSTLVSLTCFGHLAGDDEDPSDNRVSRSAPRVKKPQAE